MIETLGYIIPGLIALIGNYFLTNLLFYLINITRTRQNFFDNKIFEVIPNITAVTKELDIDDDLLIKIFNLTADDLIGYNRYVKTGEGRLDEATINKIKGFKLAIDKSTVKQIRDETQLKIDTVKIKQTKKMVPRHDSAIIKRDRKPRTIKAIKGSSGGKRRTLKRKSASLFKFWQK